MNVMHSSMKIIDEFYSNLSDADVQNRIGSLGKNEISNAETDELGLLREFLAWRAKKTT